MTLSHITAQRTMIVMILFSVYENKESVINEWCFRPRFCTCNIGPGTTWANEMNFVMKHAPGAGSIAQPVDKQSSELPLYHRCLLRNQYIQSIHISSLICSNWQKQQHSFLYSFCVLSSRITNGHDSAL